MKKIIKYSSNNPWAGVLLGIIILFTYTIFTDSFFNALIGSIFFGILATPITAFILSFIDTLLPQEKNV